MAVQNWADAIASIESAGSGGYSAVGPLTKKGNRAYGRYQVMDFNVGPWTEKYLGRRMTPQEFLNSPEAQDAVFEGEFGGYVNKYGSPQEAASVWFTGRPMAEGAGRKDILGTSGSGYVNKFNRALGQGGTQMQPTVSTQGSMGSAAPMQAEDKPKWKNPDLWANLAIAFNSMRMRPDAGLAQAMRSGIESRASQRKAAQNRNATADWLESQGATDLAAGVRGGAVPAQVALQMAMQKPKDTSTALQKNYEYALAQGMTPEQARQWVSSGTTVNVGGQQSSRYGDAPEGTVWAYDDQGQHIMEPAPGGGLRPKVTPLGGTAAEKRAAEVGGATKKSQDAAARAQDSMKLIEDVMSDPALGQITGMFQGRLPPVTQAGTDLAVKVEQLQGQAFLQAFESLKGGGQITEREGQAAQNAMARLQRAQSEEAFRQSLQELYAIMERGYRRALGETVPEYGGGSSNGFSVTGRID